MTISEFLDAHPFYLMFIIINLAIIYLVVKMVIFKKDDDDEEDDDDEGGIGDDDPVLDLPPGVTLPKEPSELVTH
ncbi:MAG: hypothetical protein AAF616_11440 [Bacteroidota bacterium]